MSSRLSAMARLNSGALTEGMTFNENSQRESTTLVLGATGKTGRRVTDRLEARGLPVRRGSRSADPAFDWNDRTTWSAAVDGVRAVYISYYPDVAAPGALETIRAFVETTVAAGVARLVFLSGRGEEEALLVEEVVKASGVEWTILRSTWFAQNFSEGDFVELIRHGEVALPAGPVGEPFVDVDDVAAVAAAALIEDRHVGQTYELTGPRLLTFADAVAEISKAAGRDIVFVDITPEQFGNALAAEGVPAEEIELWTYLFTTVLDGRNAHVADGVQRALGRPPRDFGDFVRAAAATGAWEAP